MAKPYKIKYYDKDGKKEQRRFQSGVVRTSVLESSELYKETRLKPLHDAFLEQQEKTEQNRKIQAKLREMAGKELEKEGKL